MSRPRLYVEARDSTGSLPLRVRTDQGEFVALHPMFGPDKPRRLWEFIRKDKLVEPTAFQTISLINELYTGSGPESREMKEYLSRKEIEMLWEKGIHEEGEYPFGIQTFTAVISDPYKSKLTFLDCPSCWTKEGLDTLELTKRAIEQSHKTRSVSFREACLHAGQGLGPREIEKNLLMIALCGKEGAAYAAELTNKTPTQRAFVHPPQSVSKSKPEVMLFKIYLDNETMLRFNTGSPVCSMGYSFGLRPPVK